MLFLNTTTRQTGPPSVLHWALVPRHRVAPLRRGPVSTQTDSLFPTDTGSVFRRDKEFVFRDENLGVRPPSQPTENRWKLRQRPGEIGGYWLVKAGFT